MSKSKPIIAVDLDGTVFESEKKTYKILEPNIKLIKTLIKMKENGAVLIAWTVRDKKLLEDAISYCETLGLKFDKVNKAHVRFSSSPKIYADIYLDDRSMTPEAFLEEYNR